MSTVKLSDVIGRAIELAHKSVSLCGVVSWSCCRIEAAAASFGMASIGRDELARRYGTFQPKPAWWNRRGQEGDALAEVNAARIKRLEDFRDHLLRIENQSDGLREFYREYLKWLAAGAPQGMPFDRQTDMCWNAMQHGEEMKQQFREAGLHQKFPFNNGDHRSYQRAYNQNVQHLNRKRIAWVKEYAS